jgi:hypothetical protein
MLYFLVIVLHVLPCLAQVTRMGTLTKHDNCTLQQTTCNGTSGAVNVSLSSSVYSNALCMRVKTCSPINFTSDDAYFSSKCFDQYSSSKCNLTTCKWEPQCWPAPNKCRPFLTVNDCIKQAGCFFADLSVYPNSTLGEDYGGCQPCTIQECEIPNGTGTCNDLANQRKTYGNLPSKCSSIYGPMFTVNQLSASPTCSESEGVVQASDYIFRMYVEQKCKGSVSGSSAVGPSRALVLSGFAAISAFFYE